MQYWHLAKCILYAVLALPLANVVQIMLDMTYDNFSHENDIIPASDWLFWLVNYFFVEAHTT